MVWIELGFPQFKWVADFVNMQFWIFRVLSQILNTMEQNVLTRIWYGGKFQEFKSSITYVGGLGSLYFQ